LTASAAFLTSSTLAPASTARSAPFTIGHASTP
jgi:hypothetical protein